MKPTRFRVPDVCVYLEREPQEQVFRTPPFLVVEILSKDDRPGDIQEKVRDSPEFGVVYVWVIDPGAHNAHVFTPDAGSEVSDGVLRTAEPAIEIPSPRFWVPRRPRVAAELGARPSERLCTP